MTAIKALKNNKATVFFLILKILNTIFEKEEVPNDLRKTQIKPLYKKGDQ